MEIGTLQLIISASYKSRPLRPSLEEMVERLSRERQKALKGTSEGMYTKKVVDGRTVVTGGKRLKDSGVYTPQFGKRVAQLFKKDTVSCMKLV